jgi:hypothetical protein
MVGLATDAEILRDKVRLHHQQLEQGMQDAQALAELGQVGGIWGALLLY